ncbi:nitroreductase family deazaflavin-dependent oxidoreductase [Nocardiopsis tropica]|uniref:Nitroreductase family deazaflavin-dependent oxidoreductase n=1 Tax=Nocardiopsis tropica TaxID=109330 RepID=A0ABU7KP71_9ACTN|nr:nitroreductase family deazaflavin-dependent oxidoreductase [Nocardiopsis umidischolae]MEE2051083.1 nitroreductase family deazaflavin-dependent oxidoreductase [Nocardiopsis umidischolae]
MRSYLLGGAAAVKRALYRGRAGRPTVLMRAVNRVDALMYASGVLTPRQAATLEVAGRRSGARISLPVTVTDLDGQRYLVSMLGTNANWVRNVRAAGGRALLRRRGSERIVLEELPVTERAPVLRRYLALAPGARPHIEVDRRAPLSEFAKVAHRYPVFRITDRDSRGARASDVVPPAEDTEGHMP